MSRKDRKLAKKAAKALKSKKGKRGKFGMVAGGTTVVVVLSGAALRKLGLLDSTKVSATKTKVVKAAKKAATKVKDSTGTVQDKLSTDGDEPKARP